MSVITHTTNSKLIPYFPYFSTNIVKTQPEDFSSLIWRSLFAFKSLVCTRFTEIHLRRQIVLYCVIPSPGVKPSEWWYWHCRSNKSRIVPVLWSLMGTPIEFRYHARRLQNLITILFHVNEMRYEMISKQIWQVIGAVNCKQLGAEDELYRPTL